MTNEKNFSRALSERVKNHLTSLGVVGLSECVSPLILADAQRAAEAEHDAVFARASARLQAKADAAAARAAARLEARIRALRERAKAAAQKAKDDFNSELAAARNDAEKRAVAEGSRVIERVKRPMVFKLVQKAFTPPSREVTSALRAQQTAAFLQGVQGAQPLPKELVTK